MSDVVLTAVRKSETTFRRRGACTVHSG